MQKGKEIWLKTHSTSIEEYASLQFPLENDCISLSLVLMTTTGIDLSHSVPQQKATVLGLSDHRHMWLARVDFFLIKKSNSERPRHFQWLVKQGNWDSFTHFYEFLFQIIFIWAAILLLDSLNDRHLSSLSSRGWKSEIMVSYWLESGENESSSWPVDGYFVTVCSHGLSLVMNLERGSSNVYFSYKDTDATMGASPSRLH